MLAGPPKILLVALAVLQAAVLAAAQSGAGTLTPAGCVCPDECDCDVLHETINCAGRNLQAIPTTINSCSWPGIIKMQVYTYTIQHSTVYGYSGDRYLNMLLGLRMRSSKLAPPSFPCRDLSENAIRHVPGFAFSNLLKLERL